MLFQELLPLFGSLPAHTTKGFVDTSQPYCPETEPLQTQLMHDQSLSCAVWISK